MPMEGVMKLTDSERAELERQARARTGRADSSRRARLILLLADGVTWAEIRAKLDCSDSYVDRWSKRFNAERLAGLFTRHAGRERYKVTDRVEAHVLTRTIKHQPADGSTHWSSRKLAAELGDISHMTVARIWAKHGIKPHRLEGYLASNDPNFEAKAADVIGLYLNPPAHAAVFCVDEKTAIQALDRKDPVLPLSPGRAERHAFEYFRHGTLSLYAAFNTRTGEVLGKTAVRPAPGGHQATRCGGLRLRALGAAQRRCQFGPQAALHGLPLHACLLRCQPLPAERVALGRQSRPFLGAGHGGVLCPPLRSRQCGA